jgi:hypothetical protein
MIVSEILLLVDILKLMDNSMINRINLIYQLIIDSTNLYDKTEEQLILLLDEFKQKFDGKYNPLSMHDQS